MIRYPITETELERRVEAAAPGWLADAKSRTQKFIAAGRFDEQSHAWSAVKPVFLHLQHDKCAYCERQLAAADHGGTVEHDLEHFRPKSSVAEWPDGNGSTGGSNANGYYWLAYHLMNYAASCKKCNEPLKKNYFPINRTRSSDHSLHPSRLNDHEGPLLIYPIGDIDENPAEMVTFEGIVARPVKKTGPRRRRADVTIQFFKLNDREELRRERSRVIVALGMCLATKNGRNVSRASKMEAEEVVALSTNAAAPHSSCATAFVELYRAQRSLARRLVKAARNHLKQVRAK